MFCDRCGTHNPEDAKFCSNCGNTLSSGETPIGYQDLAHAVKPKRRKKKFLAAILVIAVIIAALCIAAALSGGEISFSTANIREAVTAKSVDPVTAEPVDATDVFSSDVGIIYMAAYIRNVPPDTEVSSVWTYIENGSDAMSDIIVIDGDCWVQFNLTSSDGFSEGDYKVDIYINGKIRKTLNFTVE
jgi:hypothetical protein